MVNRRHFLGTALAALGLSLCGVGPAFADSLEDKVKRALRRQGYRDITASRTFLGRLRVTGQKGAKKREIILNRRTGEVLRDVIFENGGTGSVFGDDNGGQNRGQGKNGSSGHGDESDDAGKDNSGKGSDNSGGDGSDGHDSGGDSGGDDGGDDD